MPYSISELTPEFGDYVNWFNKLRIHGTLGYLYPLEYK
ncbi:IS3 family transposase [Peribacillus muralis]